MKEQAWQETSKWCCQDRDSSQHDSSKRNHQWERRVPAWYARVGYSQDFGHNKRGAGQSPAPGGDVIFWSFNRKKRMTDNWWNQFPLSELEVSQLAKLRATTWLSSPLDFVGLFRHYFTLLHYSCAFQSEITFWLCAELSVRKLIHEVRPEKFLHNQGAALGIGLPKMRVLEMPWCQVTVEEAGSYPGKCARWKKGINPWIQNSKRGFLIDKQNDEGIYFKICENDLWEWFVRPMICENAEQHCMEIAAALKEVRKPILGKHVTRFGTAFSVQAFPWKNKTKAKKKTK